MNPETINEIRSETRNVRQRVMDIIAELATDYTDAAVGLRVDLSHVVRHLGQCDHQLQKAQDFVFSRWVEDKEAGAIG